MSEDEMCLNCVTPWKCNGPHILEGDNEMDKYKLEWRDQKASIAVELLTELLLEVDDHIKNWDKLPDFWNKKNVKAMTRVRDILAAFYGIPYGD